MRTMKSLFIAGVASVALFLAGCGEEKSASPEEFVQEFANTIFAGDGEKAVDMVDLSDLSEDDQKAVSGKLYIMILAIPEEAKKRGGFKKLEIISIDGDCKEKKGGVCKVVAKEVFNNGTSDDSDFEVVNVDGTYKIKI